MFFCCLFYFFNLFFFFLLFVSKDGGLIIVDLLLSLYLCYILENLKDFCSLNLCRKKKLKFIIFFID